MNAFDRDNFEWYTNASAEELEQWYDEASIGELHYMLRLVQEELTSLRLAEMEGLEFEVDNYKETAAAIINRFTLKG